MPSELIELSGHIIDSWSLPRAWDLIMDRGGNFVLEEIRVGRRKTEPSYARLKVEAPNDEVLELILSELQQLGAALVHGEDAQTVAVEQNGVLPSKFYSTTNLPTQVRLKGQWVTVEGIEMDVAVWVNRSLLAIMVFVCSHSSARANEKRSPSCKATSLPRRSRCWQSTKLPAR